MNDFTADEPPKNPAHHADILYGAPRPDLLRGEVLADILEATAKRCPEQTAYIEGANGNHRISYGELDARAGLAASRLIAAGVKPGDMVGLWLPRGASLLLMQAAIATPAQPGCRSMKIRRSNGCKCASTTPMAQA